MDEVALEGFRASKPTLAVIRTFTEGFLREKGQSEEVINSMLEKVNGLEFGPSGEGVEVITDADAFRNKCERATYAVPVEECETFHFFYFLFFLSFSSLRGIE